METLAELALRLRLEAGYSNRSEFAREVGVSPQAILQIENGTTQEMKGRTLAGYIRVLGETAANKLAPYKAKEVGTPATPDEYAFIKRYEAKLSAGEGHENGDHVQVDGTHAFRISWLKKKGLSPDHLCILEVKGESMAPDLKSGDVVLKWRLNRERFLRFRHRTVPG
jgi:phage repressor protein C with HTH and peptisase S24 domain